MSSPAVLIVEDDDNLREAFVSETELFVESQLRGDRNVVELLTADYTFLNERLARHYRIQGIYGSHFRRVNLDGRRIGGLLGQGSMLTVTVGENTRIELADDWLGTLADIVNGLEIAVDFDPSSLTAFKIEIEHDEHNEHTEHEHEDREDGQS